MGFRVLGSSATWGPLITAPLQPISYHGIQGPTNNLRRGAVRFILVWWLGVAEGHIGVRKT